MLGEGAERLPAFVGVLVAKITGPPFGWNAAVVVVVACRVQSNPPSPNAEARRGHETHVTSGECMGTAFRNVRPPAPGLGLYPLVVLPSVAHETVRLARCAGGGGASSFSFPAPVG